MIRLAVNDKQSTRFGVLKWLLKLINMILLEAQKELESSSVMTRSMVMQKKYSAHNIMALRSASHKS
jgi:hypothetical protein